MTAEIAPKDEEAYTKWVTEEHHLQLVHRIPGHRRSQRYVVGPPFTDGKDPEDHHLGSVGKHFSIHEFDNLQAILGKDASAQEALANDGVRKALIDSTISVLRIWELVKPIGW